MPRMLNWKLLHPQAADMLGYIPSFIYEDDPRSAKEQFQTSLCPRRRVEPDEGLGSHG